MEGFSDIHQHQVGIDDTDAIHHTTWKAQAGEPGVAAITNDGDHLVVGEVAGKREVADLAKPPGEDPGVDGE